MTLWPLSREEQKNAKRPPQSETEAKAQAYLERWVHKIFMRGVICGAVTVALLNLLLSLLH